MSDNKEITVAPSLPQQVTVSNESQAIMNAITNACADPNMDVAKFEKMWQLYDVMQKRQAEQAFSAALANMQADLPTVVEKGMGHNSKTYALLEDVIGLVRPVMSKYGFAIIFNIEQVEKSITVTSILKHSQGHEERTSITLPHDGSGSKNAVQAIGSSISYGKRYTLLAMLNIATCGEDDDAKSSHTVLVKPAQAQTIIDLLLESDGMTKKNFATKYGAAANVLRSEFDTVVNKLRNYANEVKKEGKDDAGNN